MTGEQCLSIQTAPCHPYLGPAPILPRVRATHHHCKCSPGVAQSITLLIAEISQGSGSAQPSGSYLVKFPGAYSMSDPGVGIDVYSQPVSDPSRRTFQKSPLTHTMMIAECLELHHSGTRCLARMSFCGRGAMHGRKYHACRFELGSAMTRCATSILRAMSAFQKLSLHAFE